MPEAVLATETPVAPGRAGRWPLVGLLFLGFLWFILCRHLSDEWSANEQYSYGWFVPFFAAYLFWLRWEARPRKFESRNSKVENTGSDFGRSLPSFLLSTFAFLLFLLLPLRLFEVGNPDWRPLGWMHAAIVVSLTLSVIWRVGGTPWLKHFAFPVAFIFVAVPWVTPIEGPIVQGLMRIVAAIACETANLLGTPAQLEGSVIRINTGVVGVNEACSGVRSLQTSLMIGLLFGELKRLSVSRRVLLVAGAALVAFVANCARAFLLVWIAATRNLAAVAEWHDIAGYAIVGAVFAGTLGIATLLAGGTGAVPSMTKIPNLDATAGVPPRRFAILLALAWLISVEVAVEGWYRWHGRQLVAREQWSVQWPEGAPGFRQIPINDEVKAILRFDQGRQVAWSIPAAPPDAPAANAMLFFFRWEPGTGNILRARSHRPDICLPAVGWRQTGDYGVRTYPAAADLALPFRHFAFAIDDAKRGSVVAHAFFCMREDKVQPRTSAFDVGRVSAPEWDRDDRLRVVREGLRNPGQQVLQLVLLGTSGELTSELAETRFARLVPELIK